MALLMAILSDFFHEPFICGWTMLQYPQKLVLMNKMSFKKR